MNFHSNNLKFKFNTMMKNISNNVNDSFKLKEEIKTKNKSLLL